MQMRGSGPEAVLRHDGRFDVEAAQGLREALRRIATEVHVVLDLSSAPSVEPTALAILAACLGERPAPALTVRGLTHQQERMLRYLGVDLGDEGRDRVGDPVGS